MGKTEAWRGKQVAGGCRATVHGRVFGPRPCAKVGDVSRGGYCHLHDPSLIAEREARKVAAATTRRARAKERWDREFNEARIAGLVRETEAKAFAELSGGSPTDAEIGAVVRPALKRIAALKAGQL